MWIEQDLDGRWESDNIEKVENPDGSSLFVKRKVLFSGENWEVILATFADSDGRMKLFTARGKGIFMLGGESANVLGAREIELHSHSRYITIHQQTIMELFRHVCSSKEWKIDVEEDVSQEGCLSVPSVEKFPVEYDIIKIDDTGLYFGDYASDQKHGIKDISESNEQARMEGIFSPENRPVKLIEQPLVKKS
jgi:hypothetical protein